MYKILSVLMVLLVLVALSVTLKDRETASRTTVPAIAGSPIIVNQ